MEDIFEEAVNVVEKADHKQMCGRCSWNKFCIEQPAMTTEELNEQLKQDAPADITAQGDTEAALFKLFDTLFLAGRDISCRACPVFISRLREGPRLSQEIKRLMQEWGE